MSRALGPASRVLCAGTLQNVGFAARLQAARAGGFDAISLFASDHQHAREVEQLSDGDLRVMLADHGLQLAELDPLLNWVPGLENDFFGPGVADFMRMATELGARSLNLALPLPMALPEEALVAAFAGVCERAADRGLLVTLEALPWTAVPTVVVAERIARAAGHANGGIMVDAWHHFRSGAGNDVLDGLDGARVLGVQLSDAPAEADSDPLGETLRRRRLPGEGDIDLVDLVRRLDRIGCQAPIGVEVFSEALAERPADEIGRRAGDSLQRVLAQAR